MPRKSSSEDVEAHRQILASFRRLAATHGPAVKVRSLALKVHKDPRTIRHHLELMAVHHDVVFLNPEKSVVARVTDLDKVVQAEKSLAEREELLYSSSAGGGRHAWEQED